MKRKWMMVLGFLPLLMGIPPSHHLDAAPGLYLSKAGMALPAGTVAQGSCPKRDHIFWRRTYKCPFPQTGI